MLRPHLALRPLLALALPFTFAAACTATSDPNEFGAGGGGGSSGKGAGGNDITVSAGNGSGSGVFNGENCGSTTFGNQIPGNVLIVLDRSGSMSGGDGEPDKWGPTKSALGIMMSTASPELRMGLLPFPAGKFDDGAMALCAFNLAAPECAALFADGGCKDIDPQPAVAVAPLAQSQPQIQSWLGSNGPKGNTPTLWALKTGYQIMKELKADGERYVLLLTDGAPTTHQPPTGVGPLMIPESNIECKSLADIEAAAKIASSGTPSIKTFVIGAPGSEGAGQSLSQIALNGLTPKSPGCSAAAKDCHHQIGKGNFQAELEAVLQQIAGLITDCVFAIPMGTEEVDPDLVNVIVETSEGKKETYFDADHQDGWDYTDASKTKVQLYGPVCDAYKAEKGSKVEIVLGCKTIVK
uniref:Glycine-rich protein n=1 Tax=Phaselicystis flava TaxID=525924 RepID=A0A3S5GYH9_9BACT|nr:glycine-rich protein [Phaselicystis flava]